MSKTVVAETARKLRTFVPSRLRALVGLDGFVDQIIDVVDKRASADSYTRVETMGALGERISRAAGMSSNLELVIKRVKLGGNGPIMANALLHHGCRVTYAGLVGKSFIHPVFQDMAGKCEDCFSLADPSVTQALEFKDGKLMLGLHDTLGECTYDRLLEVVGLERLRQVWGRSHLVALTNWTMLPHQTDMWRRLLVDMTGVRPPSGALLFVDLADPEKREAQELANALQLLRKFRGPHRVVLGLNLKESMQVCAALGLSGPAGDLEGTADKVRRALDLDVLVIHPTRSAAVATAEGCAQLSGPYTESPVLTTGAGDNFNAGFCAGLMAGLSPHEALATAVGTSGYYVRTGQSPSTAELSAFMETWGG